MVCIRQQKKLHVSAIRGHHQLMMASNGRNIRFFCLSNIYHLLAIHSCVIDFLIIVPNCLTFSILETY